jgi:hypothetical protein
VKKGGAGPVAPNLETGCQNSLGTHKNILSEGCEAAYARTAASFDAGGGAAAGTGGGAPPVPSGATASPPPPAETAAVAAASAVTAAAADAADAATPNA